MTTQKVTAVCLLLFACLSAWAQPVPVITHEVVPDEDAVTRRPRGDDDWHRISLEATMEHRRILNGDYDWSSDVTLQGVVTINKHESAGLLLGVGGIALRKDTFSSKLITDPGYVQWGFFGRYCFTSLHSVVQPYVCAEARLSWLNWDYRTPMIVNGQAVTVDGVEMGEGTVGAGLAIHLLHVDAFGEVDCGGFFTRGTTDAGIEDNSFLPPAGYIGVKIGLAVTF